MISLSLTPALWKPLRIAAMLTPWKVFTNASIRVGEVQIVVDRVGGRRARRAVLDGLLRGAELAGDAACSACQPRPAACPSTSRSRGVSVASRCAISSTSARAQARTGRCAMRRERRRAGPRLDRLGQEVDRPRFIARTLVGTSPWPLRKTMAWRCRVRPARSALQAIQARHRHVEQHAAVSPPVVPLQELLRRREGDHVQPRRSQQPLQPLSTAGSSSTTNTVGAASLIGRPRGRRAA